MTTGATEDVLLIETEKNAYEPGETVRGQILWQFRKAPKRLLLKLEWWTEGKGAEERAIVESRSWESPREIGKESFQFALPEGPHSFTGKLISVRWGLSLIAAGTKKKELHPLVVAPGGWARDISRQSFEGMKSLFSPRFS